LHMYVREHSGGSWKLYLIDMPRGILRQEPWKIFPRRVVWEYRVWAAKRRWGISSKMIAKNLPFSNVRQNKAAYVVRLRLRIENSNLGF
jgi:hypothetical protein